MTKIHETKMRSFMKGVTAKTLEIIVDFTLLSLLQFVCIRTVHINISIVGSLLIEVACFCLGFINERMWNRTDWGRIIK